MEANRESAAQALAAAVTAERSGDTASAERLAAKSQRLFPTSDAKAFLERLAGQAAAPPAAAPQGASAAPPAAAAAPAAAADGAQGRSNGCAGAAASSAAAPPPSEALAQVQRSNSHYEMLGVATSADEVTIRKAYRKLAVKLHPDKTSEAGATDAFNQINAALETLTNPEQRRLYDLRLTQAMCAGFAGPQVAPKGAGNYWSAVPPFPASWGQSRGKPKAAASAAELAQAARLAAAAAARSAAAAAASAAAAAKRGAAGSGAGPSAPQPPPPYVPPPQVAAPPPAPYRVQCGHCHASLQVKLRTHYGSHSLSYRVQCPSCKGVFQAAVAGLAPPPQLVPPSSRPAAGWPAGSSGSPATSAGEAAGKPGASAPRVESARGGRGRGRGGGRGGGRRGGRGRARGGGKRKREVSSDEEDDLDESESEGSGSGSEASAGKEEGADSDDEDTCFYCKEFGEPPLLRSAAASLLPSLEPSGRLPVGELLCCDSCPRTFHFECLAIRKSDLPDGDWICPLCVAGVPFSEDAPASDAPGTQQPCSPGTPPPPPEPGAAAPAPDPVHAPEMIHREDLD